MSDEIKRPWKDFVEWRAEADPDGKMTGSEAFKAYSLWKEAWMYDVADDEIERQRKLKSA